MKLENFAGLAVAGLILYGGFKIFGGFSGLNSIKKTITDDVNMVKNTIWGFNIDDSKPIPITGYTDIPINANPQAPQTQPSAPAAIDGIQPAPYQYPIFKDWTPSTIVGVSPTLIISPAPTPAPTMPDFSMDLTKYWVLR